MEYSKYLSVYQGRKERNTLSFDPESMKRLDYLIYCLKKEGIYCYLDIFTYRKFKTGDGIENAFELGMLQNLIPAITVK